jgi:selenide,water dikinase
LNLLAFPANKLGQEVLHGIIAGAAGKILEAGAVLVGGHSIEDEEPKFGLAVTGMVHPQKIWRNNGARVGDALLLTKSLGSGVLLNANLKGWVSQEAIEECFRQLATLNRIAAETLQAFNVHAATDITGFGLAGHALEIAQGSTVTIEIETQNLPWLPEAAAMYERGMTTGTNQANRKLVEDDVEFPTQQVMQELLVDPQTSGGLLVSLPAEEADIALNKLREAGVPNACLIGHVIPRGNKGIRFF